jgi:iron complex outermembrane receptor protein
MKQLREVGARAPGMTMRLALLASSCLIGMSSAAMAQTAAAEAADDDAIVITAQRSMTGTKTDVPLVQIPQSISIVTADQFKDRAAVDFQEVFRYNAGIRAEGTGLDTRNDSFSSRGFATVQYLDGINRMPGAVYGARLEVFTVERAEVLRGPSSTLYGAGGVGGLFNAWSKRPKDEFGGQVGVVIGTQNRKELQLDVTGPLTEGISARFVGLARDGNLMNDSQPDRRLLANPSITFKPGPDTEITLIGLYQRDRNGTQTYLPTSKTIHAQTAADRISINTFLGEPDFNHMDSDYKTGTLLVTHNFGNVATFNSRSRIFGMKVDYAEIYGLASYADPLTRRRVNRSYYVLKTQYDGWASDNNVNFKFATGPLEHQMLFGVDYTYFHENKREGFPAAPAIDIYNPVYGVNINYPAFSNAFENKNTNLGFYAQENIRAWDRVSLVFGARHDKITSEQIRTTGTTQYPDNTAWTFRAGITADLVKGVTPYANYSESFQPVFGSNFNRVPFVARPGRQYEVGVKFTPNRMSMVTVSAYDIKEDNYISRDPDNIQNSIQKGSVGSKGVEVEAGLQLPGDVQVNAAYSYTRAKWLTAGGTNIAGDRIGNLPKHMASLWLGKGFQLTDEIGMRVGGGIRYSGSQIDSFQQFTTPANTLADAMAEFSYKDWKISVNGSNIFNTTVYTNCSRNPLAADGYCFFGRRRNVMMSIRRSF